MHYRLCCQCGVQIEPNPANMCVACLRTQVDITEGIPKTGTLYFCKGCERYIVLRCSLWQNLIYSAYLVNWGYANFKKKQTAWMWIIWIPRLMFKVWKFCEKTVIISEDFWCLILNLRTCTVVIHTICKPPVNAPIGSYQIQHLKKPFHFHLWKKYL